MASYGWKEGRIKIARVIVLIDGEHYLPVIYEAIEKIQIEWGYELVGAVLLGGTEKLISTKEWHLELPLIDEGEPLRGVRKALRELRPELVVDLSGEPVVGYRERFQIASLVLAAGASYLGADFRFDPPRFYERCQKPSLSIIGTGKRVGKTAISAYLARLLKREGLSPIVVAMGRGGPEVPEVLEDNKSEINAQFLMNKVSRGEHAASDYVEDALMSGVVSIGARRCGDGLAGAPFTTNVLQAVELANKTPGKLVIFEGSGSAIPPVKVDRTVLTVASHQPVEYIKVFFGPYRIFLSNLVVLTQCEEPFADIGKVKSLHQAIKSLKPGLKVVWTRFRPQPLESIEGESVFFATTTSSLMREKLKVYLEERFKCEVVGMSSNLANRELLKNEMSLFEGRYQVALTELKAAAVDIVTRSALENGLRVVYVDNVPEAIGGDEDLDQAFLRVVTEVMER